MIRPLTLATGFFVLSIASAQADAVSDFYTGKTISLIISTGVGGGVDTNARIIAKHMGDRKSTRLNSSHIPLSRMPSSA